MTDPGPGADSGVHLHLEQNHEWPGLVGVFGAYGAFTFMALSGVLLDRLRAVTSPAAPPLPRARTKAMAE